MRKKNNLSLLKQAYLITKKASNKGFDWNSIDGVLQKLEEETIEFKKALSTKRRREIMEEIGDLFFILVNISRFLNIDPEKALKKSIDKFVSRFRYVEESLKKIRKTFDQSNLTEMNHLWEKSKKRKKIK